VIPREGVESFDTVRVDITDLGLSNAVIPREGVERKSSAVSSRRGSSPSAVIPREGVESTEEKLSTLMSAEL
jgi:hypothetical protein